MKHPWAHVITRYIRYILHDQRVITLAPYFSEVWPCKGRNGAVNGRHTAPAGVHTDVPNRTRRQYRRMARDSITSHVAALEAAQLAAHEHTRTRPRTSRALRAV